MINLRPAKGRGHTEIDWLDSWHTFSFDQYYDPEWTHFRKLRVINEDIVKPGNGFPTHPHHDMEIITYILEGELAHRDSIGNGSVIKPGEVQRMSAGKGVTHSEFNHSKSKPVHLLQIWILPDQAGLEPSYEQKMFEPKDRLNRLLLVASESPEKNIVKIHQDVNLYACILESGKKVEHEFEKNRFGWLQVARGEIRLNDLTLKAGDGAAISKEKTISIYGASESEFLLFDLN